ncbi:hypothetical protein CAPTEDRAFT_148381 [Capitella teleta]|uniref:EGF-like domain-containing protein n=1 Tax=Capitella teleta TaxID=283909 RepID=R7VLV3_CAPTE|nr:hypothetical protein CAPTEDRAFT_148381 [Capitella teleta]|eukprot:ELU17940.1 hypothetical protein CAPTEDRAFT_148381 [Capitella teleta]
MEICCSVPGVADPCLPNPCLNGGVCTGDGDTFTCTCQPGYEGDTCGTDINECDPNPCNNGGTCTDELNDFSCVCPTGFTGSTCSEVTDETCGVVSQQFQSRTTLSCAQFIARYTSDDLLNSRCRRASISDCQNQVGANTWPSSASIVNCRQYHGLLIYNIEYCCQAADSGSDPCSRAGQPCQNGGTCVNYVYGFSCQCASGFYGRLCEHDMSSYCGAWSSWSGCSRPCGGCGVMSRYRICGGTRQYQSARCNVTRCPWAQRWRHRCCYNFHTNSWLNRPGRYCGRVGGLY